VDLPDCRVITYVIDAQNRRIGKKVNGALVKAWLYQDQLEPVAELDGAGNSVARFVYGSRPNIPDAADLQRPPRLTTPRRERLHRRARPAARLRRVRARDARLEPGRAAVRVRGRDLRRDTGGLYVQAGSEALTRDPASGLVTGTTLLSTATAQAYNPFGELEGDGASFASTALYANAYTRDKLGGCSSNAAKPPNPVTASA
jgi:hypothetical protein